jgi:hypothetical protein
MNKQPLHSDQTLEAGVEALRKCFGIFGGFTPHAELHNMVDAVRTAMIDSAVAQANVKPKVRSKWRVQSSVPYSDQSTGVYLCPVYAGSEENDQFWRATPNGSLQMTLTIPEAAGIFESGTEFYVDFIKAE